MYHGNANNGYQYNVLQFLFDSEGDNSFHFLLWSISNIYAYQAHSNRLYHFYKNLNIFWSVLYKLKFWILFSCKHCNQTVKIT